jgi:hypothetical protein
MKESRAENFEAFDGKRSCAWIGWTKLSRCRILPLFVVIGWNRYTVIGVGNTASGLTINGESVLCGTRMAHTTWKLLIITETDKVK